MTDDTVTLELPFSHSDRTHSWRGDPDSVPEPGDSVSMGTTSMCSTDHYRITTDPDDALFLELPATAWGDYDSSGTVERSNYRSILRDYPQYVTEVYGGYNSNFLVIRVGAEFDEDFLDTLRGLAEDYPLYDEGDHSDLEMELEQEDWESYGRDDFVRGIVKAAEADLMVTDAEVDALSDMDEDDADELFREISEADYDQWWVAETATGGYFPDLDRKAADAYEVLKKRDALGWEAYAHSLIPTQDEVLVHV